MQGQQSKKFSVLVLGPVGAGKTSLLLNLKGCDAAKSVPTMGLDCCFYEDTAHKVKGTFFDPSGGEQFLFARKAVLQEKKDCIVVIVDNLNFDDALSAIDACLNEIDQSCGKDHAPLGLIINQKANSHAGSIDFYNTIARKYSDRFVFVDHCSVLNKSYRFCLFNQFARISGVPVLHEEEAAPQGWYSYVSYVASFFQPSPPLVAVADTQKPVELMENAAPAVAKAPEMVV